MEEIAHEKTENIGNTTPGKKILGSISESQPIHLNLFITMATCISVYGPSQKSVCFALFKYSTNNRREFGRSV
jgi:hypothetical protein